MGDFTKTIWKSNNPDKIQDSIESSHGGGISEQQELDGIALHCPIAELRAAAAKKLKC